MYNSYFKVFPFSASLFPLHCLISVLWGRWRFRNIVYDAILIRFRKSSLLAPYRAILNWSYDPSSHGQWCINTKKSTLWCQTSVLTPLIKMIFDISVSWNVGYITNFFNCDISAKRAAVTAADFPFVNTTTNARITEKCELFGERSGMSG